MKTLKQTYEVNSTIDKVWRALVDPNLIKSWSGDKAKMSEQEGSKFELWNGDIFGINLRVVKNKILEQEWSAGDWNPPSKVIISLENQGSKVKINLLHEGIPDEEFSGIEDGWKSYYFGEIKKLLE